MEKRKKLESKSIESIFSGYNESTKGYKLYNQKTTSSEASEVQNENPTPQIID